MNMVVTIPFGSMIFPAINFHLVSRVSLAMFDYQRVTTVDFPSLVSSRIIGKIGSDANRGYLIGYDEIIPEDG